jgi:hypothetical protein
MTRPPLVALVLSLVLCWATALRADDAPAQAPLDYNRDIRPILAHHCYACHGPDAAKREAELRLDVQQSALAKLPSGATAIVPGSSGTSALVERITSADQERRMPPPDSGKSLSAGEIARLSTWIDQGAAWSGHWSYAPLQRATLPPAADSSWLRSPIDSFILHKLAAAGWAPSPEADRPTLIRRLSFDLTGLPPTIAEVDAFVADTSPDAYERVVDRLLASPRYGERMAQRWLDLARYADTNGYHIDNHRDMWRYREWVIAAFNRNLPFDQFTTEQIAGDLLPGATLDQQIASGFHRNVMVNFEGGADPDEYLTKYIVDRVTTTATVWLGTTLACAECHDHKYDPFTQREFYQLYAYFNGVPEQGLDGRKENPAPSIRVPSPKEAAQLAEYDRQAADIEARVQVELAKLPEPSDPEPAPLADLESEHVWVDDALPPGATADGDQKADSWRWVESPQPVLHGRRASERTVEGLSQQLFTGAKYPLLVGQGDRFVAHVFLDPANPPAEIMLQFHAGSWQHRAYWGANQIDWGSSNSPSRRALGPLPAAGRWVRLEVDAAAVGLQPGAVVDGWACTQFGGHVYWDKLALVTRLPQGSSLFDRQSTWEMVERAHAKPTAPPMVQEALRIEPRQRSAPQRRAVRDYFARYYDTHTRGTFGPLEREARAIDRARTKLESSLSSTMVMQEMPKPRQTFVLVRGDFRSKGEKVLPAVPASLPPLPSDAPPNRLGLARWLADPANPLVARVTVNRYWQQYFGVGLVKTSEDFGTQGEPPSHPELLDWLAAEFIASGWDVKRLQKQIVMSAAYRQSSRVAPAHVARDPENRLLARGPRFRLDAEMIRDHALAVSGLLDGRMGGPSVSPYQPPGLWEAISFGREFSAQTYVQSHGADLYRRGLYVYWKRSLPYPPLATFDAPNREVCTDCRARTNTPLQALVLLNDPAFVEAARVLAQRLMAEGGSSPIERIAFAFKLCTARAPRERELATLLRIYETQRAHFQQHPEAAARLVRVGEAPRPAGIDECELAAWTAIGNVLLNLDETITKG